MTWDYAYTLGGTALSDYAKSPRINPDWISGIPRGGNPPLPFQHGEAHTRKWFDPPITLLELLIRYTDAAGAITHTDGEAGHAYENASEARRLIGSLTGPVTLARTAPHHGPVQVPVELVGQVTQGDPRFRLLVPIKFLEPWWESTTEQNTTGNPVVGGSAPVADMRVSFANAGRVTHNTSGDYIEITGAPAGGFPVVVDVGARTIIDNAGDNADGVFDFNRPWWLEFAAATTATLTRTGTATVFWRDHWF